MTSKGLISSRARAKHVGLSPSTVLRIEKGGMQPGGEFIAAALASSPDIKFEDFFEIGWVKRVAS